MSKGILDVSYSFILPHVTFYVRYSNGREAKAVPAEQDARINCEDGL